MRTLGAMASVLCSAFTRLFVVMTTWLVAMLFSANNDLGMLPGVQAARPGMAIAADKLLAQRELIEQTLQSGVRWLFFPCTVECMYEHDRERLRQRQLWKGGLLAILIYNLFLLMDRLMLPDIFFEAMVIRLGIVTPLMLAVLYGIRRGLPAHWRELALLVMNLVIIGSLLVMLDMSHYTDSIFYHPGIYLVLMFASVVVQLNFWFTLLTCLFTIALYVLIKPVPPGVPDFVFPTYVLMLVTTALFSVFACYTLERNERRTYLAGLLDQIRQLQLARLNDELRMLSYTDPLTGLANRREMSGYLAQLSKARQREEMGVIMLDVDHFKHFNDRYGHPAGDRCLRTIADTLQSTLRRKGDMVARFGGEEFVVLLPGGDLHIARLVAEKMCSAIKALRIPHQGAGEGNIVTISAGVAVGSVDLDIDEPLRLADEALYRAKSAGRDCVSA